MSPTHDRSNNVPQDSQARMRARAFRGSAAPYALSTIVERISTLFFLSYLGRGFGPSWLGAWSQIALISGLAVPVLTLQAAQSFVRFLPGKGQSRDRIRFIRVLIFLPQMLMAGLIFVTFLIHDRLLDALFPDSPTERMLVLLVLFVWSEIQADLINAEFRADQRIAAVGALSIIRSVARIAWVLVSIEVLGMDVTTSLGSFLIAQLAMLTMLLFRPRTRGKNRDEMTDPPEVGYGLFTTNARFVGPLMLVGVIGYANSFMDRYAIVPQFGLESLAVYSVTYGTLGIVVLFYVVYGYSVYPKISHALASNDWETIDYLYTFLVGGFGKAVLIVGAWWVAVGPWVLERLFGVADPGLATLGNLQLVLFLCLGLIQIATYVLQLSIPTSRFLLPVIASTIATLTLLLVIRDRFGLTGIAAANLVPTMMLTVWYLHSATGFASLLRERRMFGQVVWAIFGLVIAIICKMIADTSVVLILVALITLYAAVLDVRVKKWSILRNLGTL